MRGFDEALRSDDVTFTALHSVERARPPGTFHRRYRRRGPRSHDALCRRRHRGASNVSQILPQGGGPCQSGPDLPLIHDDVTFFIAIYAVLLPIAQSWKHDYLLWTGDLVLFV